MAAGNLDPVQRETLKKQLDQLYELQLLKDQCPVTGSSQVEVTTTSQTRSRPGPGDVGPGQLAGPGHIAEPSNGQYSRGQRPFRSSYRRRPYSRPFLPACPPSGPPADPSYSSVPLHSSGMPHPLHPRAPHPVTSSSSHNLQTAGHWIAEKQGSPK